MAQDISIEYPDKVVFITTRTMRSELWFVNNPKLEERIKAYLAKYAADYGAQLYAFVIMGNHIHIEAKFPNCNRARFMRAFNSIVAALVRMHCENFTEGKLWARRARSQPVPNDEDVENWFFYTALNPVSSGLVERISDYPIYNSFSDAISGITRTFSIVDWTDYNNRKRYNSNLTIKECTHKYELRYERLPGYEQMSRAAYKKLMLKRLEERRIEIIQNRRVEGKGFAGKKVLKKTVPGCRPHSTKKASRHSRRPLVLTLCKVTRAEFLDRYFKLLRWYKEASKLFRSGDLLAQFPPWTYRPPLAVPG
jgi:REP element-mobilizing transposase RayT